MPALLSAPKVAAALSLLPSWTVEGVEMVKLFRFPTYLAGVDFVSSLARAAETMNHHPDIHLGWRKVRVRLTTHSAGGLTVLDTRLATVAESLASAGVTPPVPEAAAVT